MTNWAKQWLVIFSPPKSKSMTISSERDLQMGDTPLTEVVHFKHLGVTFQSDLSWNKHVTNIVSKADKSLDVMLALKYKLDRKTLEIIYMSFIRPILEYADIIWDNCDTYFSDRIEKCKCNWWNYKNFTYQIIR